MITTILAAPGSGALSLNPYCNGCTSMIHEFLKVFSRGVSILIVMDVLQ